MHGQTLVGAFFAALLVPVIGMAFCWRAWRKRAYPERKRQRVAHAGLAVGSVAVVFAAALPAFAMLPVHLQSGASEMLAGIGMVAGVAACPLAAVLLGFGFGLERWLGMACVLLALSGDMAMLLGA